jgi:hypothetical protein
MSDKMRETQDMLNGIYLNADENNESLKCIQKIVATLIEGNSSIILMSGSYDSRFSSSSSPSLVNYIFEPHNQGMGTIAIFNILLLDIYLEYDGKTLYPDNMLDLYTQMDRGQNVNVSEMRRACGNISCDLYTSTKNSSSNHHKKKK